MNKIRLAGTALIGTYFFYCLANPTLGHFIDYIDLIIHEAGHWIFIFFGQFIQVLGGSFLQILVPAIFVVYFFLRKENFSASILLFWLGYSIVNVSIYMRDAIVMQLPLLGGESVIHDWNYILSSLHLLGETYLLSDIAYFIGFSTIIAAALLSLRNSVGQADAKAIDESRD